MTEPASEIPVDQARTPIASMALIVYNTHNLYWLSKTDARQAMAKCFTGMANLFESVPKITFRIQDDVLLVNDTRMPSGDPRMKTLLDQLKNLELYSFSLSRGLAEEEFAKFMEMISAPASEAKKDGGVTESLYRLDIKHVAVKKVVVKEVEAGEELVLRDGKTEEAGKHESPGRHLEGNILAFLKGDIAPGDPKIPEAAREMASDPERMADLIMRAAEVREQSADFDRGETLSDFVIGSLRRAFKEFAGDKAAQTKKGNQALRKTLLLLEKKIVDKLRAGAGGQCGAGDIDAVSETVADMVESLKVQGAAAEYMGKLHALAECEKRIASLMKGNKPGSIVEETLHNRLAGMGLEESEWHKLVVRGGRAPVASLFLETRPVIEAIRRLESLLEKIEKTGGDESDPERETRAKKMLDILGEIDEKIRRLGEATSSAIQELIAGLRTDEAVVDEAEAGLRGAGQRLMLSRKQALAFLARIIRDIGEPLAMIKTSLDMLGEKTFGDISESQAKALSIASANADVIKGLLAGLENISVPVHGSQ